MSYIISSVFVFFALFFCIFITSYANVAHVAVTNRMDIRCTTGDCRTFCLTSNSKSPPHLLISEKCDGKHNITIPPGETRVLTLETAGDISGFCLEDGYQQIVHKRTDRLIYASWRGFKQVKAVGLFPHHQFAKPVFNNQITAQCPT